MPLISSFTFFISWSCIFLSSQQLIFLQLICHRTHLQSPHQTIKFHFFRGNLSVILFIIYYQSLSNQFETSVYTYVRTLVIIWKRSRYSRALLSYRGVFCTKLASCTLLANTSKFYVLYIFIPICTVNVHEVLQHFVI